MRHVMLLHYQLILLLGLLPHWLGTLGSVAELLQVLIHPVCQHHLPAILPHGILPPQVTKCIPVRLIDTLGDHLLPAVDPLPLPPQLLLLVFALLPLFVGDAGHDALVGLGLALALLEVALFLVHILLLDLLVLLLEQALLEPLFKQAIGCLLLGLFLKPL